jgi:hypothetical protein
MKHRFLSFAEVGSKWSPPLLLLSRHAAAWSCTGGGAPGRGSEDGGARLRIWGGRCGGGIWKQRGWSWASPDLVARARASAAMSSTGPLVSLKQLFV